MKIGMETQYFIEKSWECQFHTSGWVWEVACAAERGAVACCSTFEVGILYTQPRQVKV